MIFSLLVIAILLLPRDSKAGEQSREIANKPADSGAERFLRLSNAGTKWIRRFERGAKSGSRVKGNLTITNRGRSVFQGADATLFEWKYSYPTGTVIRNVYLKGSAHGILLLGYEQEVPSRPGKDKESVTYKPPMVVLKGYGRPTSWEYRGVSESSTGKITRLYYKRSFVGRERIRVPVGLFNAVKLVIEGTDESWTEWWVEDLGVVKIENPSQHFISELISSSLLDSDTRVAREEQGSRTRDLQVEHVGSEQAAQSRSSATTVGRKTEAPGFFLAADDSTGTRFWVKKCFLCSARRPCPNGGRFDVVGEVPSNISLSDDDVAKKLIQKGKEHAETACPRFKIRHANTLKVSLYVGHHEKGKKPRVEAEWKRVVSTEQISMKYRNRALQEKLGRRVEGNFVIFGADEATGTQFGVLLYRDDWRDLEPCLFNQNNKSIFGRVPGHINLEDDSISSGLVSRAVQAFEQSCPEVKRQSARLQRQYRRNDLFFGIKVYLLREQQWSRLQTYSTFGEVIANYHVSASGNVGLKDIRNYAKERAQQAAQKAAREREVKDFRRKEVIARNIEGFTLGMDINRAISIVKQGIRAGKYKVLKDFTTYSREHLANVNLSAHNVVLPAKSSVKFSSPTAAAMQLVFYESKLYQIYLGPLAAGKVMDNALRQKYGPPTGSLKGFLALEGVTWTDSKTELTFYPGGVSPHSAPSASLAPIYMTLIYKDLQLYNRLIANASEISRRRQEEENRRRRTLPKGY